MIDQEDILLTLRERLLDSAVVERTRVSWQNRPFKPDPDTYYVREHLTITSNRQIANGRDRAMGIYHLDVFVPKGTGTKTPLAVVRGLQTAFPFPDDIVGSITVHVDRTEPLSGRSAGDAWFAYPVQIRWRAVRAT